MNGYGTGLYATWYADDESRNGAYLDSWAQYSWFDNTVKGDDLQSEKLLLIKRIYRFTGSWIQTQIS